MLNEEYQVYNKKKEEDPDLPLSTGEPTISVGLFGIREDHIEKFQSLDERFIKNKTSTFFFEAQGTAMAPLILEKDVILVDRSVPLKKKAFVVFSYNGEMLCRQLASYPEPLVFKALHPQYKDLVIHKQNPSFVLFGVVIGSARDLYPTR